MNGRTGILLAAAVAVAMSGCGHGGAGRTAATAAPPSAGWFEIPVADLEGRPVTLAQLTAGRPALVNLWAPWCERCKTELPDLDRLSRRFEGCAVIVGVAVGEDVPTTAAFVRQRGLVYPQVVDQGFHLADALRQSRVPTTVVLDGAGAIVHLGQAVDGASVGALESALARVDADGHCKGGRTAGAG